LNETVFFDWDIAKPYLILMGLSLLGFAAGIFRLVWQDAPDYDTIALNLIWTAYNLMMLGASIAVANEARQVRQSHRVQMKMDAALRLPNGRSYACSTSDYSDGGVGLTVLAPVQVQTGDEVRLALTRGMEEFEFDAKVTMNKGTRLGLQFGAMTTQQSIDFVQCTFARADSWVVWGDKRKPDKPLESLKEVAWMGLSGFKVLGALLWGAWRERKARMQANFNLNNVRAALDERQAKLRSLATRKGEAGKGAS
jgi:cellulose synthase (UDP-forming)